MQLRVAKEAWEKVPPAEQVANAGSMAASTSTNDDACEFLVQKTSDDIEREKLETAKLNCSFIDLEQPLKELDQMYQPWISSG